MDLKEAIDRTDILPSIPIDEIEVEAEAEAFIARLQYNVDKVAMAVATQTVERLCERKRRRLTMENIQVKINLNQVTEVSSHECVGRKKRK